MSKLAVLIADALTQDAAALGARWRAQARFVAPRTSDRADTRDMDAGSAAIPGPDDARPARERTDDARASEPASPERLVRAIAGALRGDALAHDALMRAGWDAGTAAHGAAVSLHYLLKELDLLMAMVLYAGKRALGGRAEGSVDVGASAADGLEVARRVQRAFSLLTLAASKGFAHAHAGRLQEEYRGLRHELRNPLGTIRSAISLMEDERLPVEVRDSPRFRAMVLRNATSIDALIAERLSDTSAVAPEFGRREVSLRDIALAVRRDLREEARARGCEVVVGESLPTALVDPTAFELALTSALTTAIHAARHRSAVTVTLRERRERSAVLAVVHEPPIGRAEPAAPPPLAFASELLQHAGGRVWMDEAALCLEVPTPSAAHLPHDVAGTS